MKKLPRAIRSEDTGATGSVQDAAEMTKMAPMRQDPDREAETTIAKRAIASERPQTVVSTEVNKTTPDVTEAFAARRYKIAVKLAEHYSWWSGFAGFIPLPLIDLAVVGAVQIQMLRRISQVYDVPFSENRGKALIAGLVGSTVPMTSVIGATSIARSVPVIGTAVSTFAMPALSAGATYAIGMAFIQHFASGGTVLDFNPQEYRAFVEAQKRLRRVQS